jgi:alcohol dehydrogenase
MGFRGVMGHEWVGEVVAAPDAAWIGQRVVGDINAPCGTCATCRAGRPRHCPERTVLGIAGRDGAFSERFSVPLGALHRVDAAIPDECAVFVEPLAAACEIAAQIHVRPTDRVVVLGAGRLGQLCARVLALTGADVTVLSRRADPLALLPASITARAVTEDEATRWADIVVDCTGSAAGLGLATRLVRPRGVVVMKTTVHAPDAVTPTPWVLDEVTLVGSRCGAFAPALRLLASGAVDPRPLITGRFALVRAAEALGAAAAPEHVKVLIEGEHGPPARDTAERKR